MQYMQSPKKKKPPFPEVLLRGLSKNTPPPQIIRYI